MPHELPKDFRKLRSIRKILKEKENRNRIKRELK